MADPQLLANQASSLIASLNSVSATRSFGTYSYPKNLRDANIKAHSVSYSTLLPNSTKALNARNQFNIPKQGFMTKAYIRIVLKNPETTNCIHYSRALAPLLINEVSLLSQGRRLFFADAHTILAYASQEPYNSRKSLEAAMGLSASGTAVPTVLAGKTVEFFVPVPFHCFNDITASLFTDFYENLTLNVSLGDASQLSTLGDNVGDASNPSSATDTAGTLTLETLEVIAEYRRVDSKEENDIIQYNFADGNLVQVNMDNIVETNTKTLSNAADQKIDLTFSTNRVASQIFLMVDKQSQSDASDYVNNRGEFVELKSIKLTAGGQTILSDNVPAKCLQLLNQHDIDARGISHSNFWDAATKQSCGYIYCLNLGLSKSMKRFSSGVSLRELTSFKAEVVLASDTPGAVPHTLTAVIVSPGLMSISSASGRLTQSLNS